MRKPFLILCLTVILISLLPIISGEAPQKPMAGEPNITIELDQPEQSVGVEPGDDGVLRFSGTVYCDLPPTTPPGQYCVVQLQADAEGWPVSVPPALTFDRTKEEEDFALDIQVPIETSQRNVQLSISGRWRYSPGAGGGTLTPVIAIIIVEAYSRPILGSDDKNNTFPVGKWVEVPIRVTNDGNSNDNVQLEITNVPDGLEAYFPIEEANIQEGQSKVIKMKVRQSTGSPKSHRVEISATGINGGRKEVDTHTVNLETTTSAKSFFTNPYLLIPFVILLLVIGFTGFMLYKKKRKVKVEAII
jgi:hypothetical protein